MGSLRFADLQTPPHGGAGFDQSHRERVAAVGSPLMATMGPNGALSAPRIRLSRRTIILKSE